MQWLYYRGLCKNLLRVDEQQQDTITQDEMTIEFELLWTNTC